MEVSTTVPTSAAPTPFSLLAPTEAFVAAAIARSAGQPSSYEPVGARAGTLPAGFHHDVQRAGIGHGEQAWNEAIAGLRDWRHFGVWALDLCRSIDVTGSATRRPTRRPLGGPRMISSTASHVRSLEVSCSS